MLPLGIALHARAALQLAPACAVNASLHAAQLLSFATHASEHSKPGVFGVPGLHTPADFQRLQQQARARCAVRDWYSTFQQHACSQWHAMSMIMKCVSHEHAAQVR